MKIKDIMTADVVTVAAGMGISDVANLLAENRIHGVPVVDERKKVLGIITETDFFTKDASNIHLPSFVNFIKNEKLDDGVDKNADIELLVGATAKDIMSTQCFVINQEFQVEELVKIFKEVGYKTIPVINEKEELVGIVTLADIIKLL